MAEYTIDAGRMTWTGKTKKEARENRDEHLERIFAQGKTMPELVSIAGHVRAVVFLDVYTGDWSYALVKKYRNLQQLFLKQTVQATYNFHQALFACKRHLAQQYFDELVNHPLSKANPAQARIEAATESLKVIDSDDAAGKREHEQWCLWQNGYAALRAMGYTDEEARERLQ